MLHPGHTEVWHTARPPSTWQGSDRLLCWESSPGLRLVGLAELSNAHIDVSANGETLFEVKYLTHILQSTPTIDELRKIPIVEEASFLKSGPATTVQPVSDEQAKVLIRLIHARNLELEPVWGDIELNVFAPIIPDVDLAASGLEGRKKLVHHLVRERDRSLIDKKKKAVLRTIGRLACEVCSFNFEDVYGDRGRDFCEVHHLIPLSDLDTETETRLEDLAIVCSNCHRMIHQRPWIQIDELKKDITKTFCNDPCSN